MQLTSYRNIWSVAYPIIAGSVAQNINNVVDAAFLGRLGPVALGAAGNAILFYFIFVVTGLGFAIGAEIIVARRNGEGNFHEVGRVVEHGFCCLFFFSFIIFFVLKFFSSDFLGLVTENQDVLTTSNEYFNMRINGIFFAFLNLSFRIYYVGVLNTYVLTWSTALMAIINTLLDYLLIFGKYGFPEMGVEGAALASVIAEGSATLFFFVYTIKKVDRNKYMLFRFRKISISLFKSIFKTASPLMIQQFAAVTGWLAFFLIIEKVGSDELATSHIIRSIYMVLLIPLFGFSAATNSLVSNLIGKGMVKDIYVVIKRISILNLSITAWVLLPAIFFPYHVVSIYTDDPELIKSAVSVLYVVSGALVIFCVTHIMFSAVSGTGNTAVSLLIELITLLVYLNASWWLAIDLKASLPIIWCSEFVYLSIIGFLSFLYLRFGNWQRKLI